jgi:1-acyl-sn-glycerol-3-phosphate acyltransferase
MGHLSFDRLDAKARLRQVEELEECLRRNESVFVFPEGTFTPEEGVRPFQLGAFHAAIKTGVPIIPVALAGTRKFLRDGTILPRPSSVTITLSAPVFPQIAKSAGDGTEANDWHSLVQLRDKVREEIASHCGEAIL